MEKLVKIKILAASCGKLIPKAIKVVEFTKTIKAGPSEFSVLASFSIIKFFVYNFSNSPPKLDEPLLGYSRCLAYANTATSGRVALLGEPHTRNNFEKGQTQTNSYGWYDSDGSSASLNTTAGENGSCI